MEKYRIAHIKVSNQDVILVEVAWTLGSKTPGQQESIRSYIEQCAHAAGLAGTVALVWQSGKRIMSFGPTAWHGYLSSLTPEYVLANLRNELTCG